MLRYLIILLLPLTLFSQTEEKRLALVIGNSNYDKGPLNNPVNDALLMARTLDSLDFDVILDTNISNKENFIRTIREFGNKRSDYDVAFVYYAGHGIQVGAENFLLPTKVNFETEYDVIDFGVSVQNIMRYLTGMTNQVNILVLDACRDNPFEGNWNKTRSLKGGGLAKIPPPTGSLIAFSTDAGNTAADGDGENSIYCQSLCKNMKLSDISLDQVFRNVRSDVLKQTNGNQRPVEASQLTGETYYFNSKSIQSYEQDFLTSINNDNYKYAGMIADKMAISYKDHHISWLLKGHILHIENKFQEAIKCYKKSLDINNCTAGLFSFLGNSQHEVGLINSVQQLYFASDSLDSKMIEIYFDYFQLKNKTYEDIFVLSQMYHAVNDRESANKIFITYVDLLSQPKKNQTINILGTDYIINKNNNNDSLNKYAVEVSLLQFVYRDLAFNLVFEGDYLSSLKYINKAIEIGENNALLGSKVQTLISLKRFNEAELVIKKIINNKADEEKSLEFYNLAKIKILQNEYDQAIDYVNKIFLQPESQLSLYDSFDNYQMYFYSSIVNYISGNYITSYSHIEIADYLYPNVWYTSFIKALVLTKLDNQELFCGDLLIQDLIKEETYNNALSVSFPEYTFADMDFWQNEVNTLVKYYKSHCR